jgi:hypothetical protein
VVVSDPLVIRYLRFHQAEPGQADSEADRAAAEVEVMVTTGRPEEAWPIIVAAIELTGDDDTLAALGAGDLETLVVNYGPAFIDRIEAEAQTSERFRRALKFVWASTSSVWPRIEAVVADRT